MNSEPSESRFGRGYRKYMLVVGMVGNVFFFVQAWHIFRNQSADDVNLLAFVIALWAVSSWFGYGVVKRDAVLIAANVVGVTGAAMVVVGKLMYS